MDNDDNVYYIDTVYYLDYSRVNYRAYLGEEVKIREIEHFLVPFGEEHNVFETREAAEKEIKRREVLRILKGGSKT